MASGSIGGKKSGASRAQRMRSALMRRARTITGMRGATDNMMLPL